MLADAAMRTFCVCGEGSFGADLEWNERGIFYLSSSTPWDLVRGEGSCSSLGGVRDTTGCMNQDRGPKPLGCLVNFQPLVFPCHGGSFGATWVWESGANETQATGPFTSSPFNSTSLDIRRPWGR